MKKFIFIGLFAFQNLFSQVPVFEWQKTIGGSDGDVGASMIKTNDGGFIIGGGSNSTISGEKTSHNRGGGDFWVIKLNNQGQIEWQKTIGGSEADSCQNIIQTLDNGYVLIGVTMSNISAEKTTTRISTLGNIDQWMVKIDQFGEIQWQKQVGQIDYDFTEPILREDKNGNILLACNKYYLYYDPNGTVVDCGKKNNQINSNQKNLKTLSVDSETDYYIAKFSSDGDFIFDKTIGGSNGDVLTDLIVTQDGNYLLSGYSNSQLSLDKTMNTFGVGKPDIWLVKLAQNGNILWQNSYGGNGFELLLSTVELDNGNVVLFCNSFSEISGNRTLPNIGSPFNVWMVTIDTSGQIIDQKIITTDDQPNTIPKFVNSVSKTSNDDFLFAGGMYNNSTQISNQHIWKVSSMGDIIYEKTILGNQFDQIATIFETNDNGTMINLFSDSGIGGDKTEYCRGNWDIWLIKLAPELLSTNNQVLSEMSVSPNPTTGTINIAFGQIQSLLQIKLSNVLGQLIFSKTISNLDKTTLEINEAGGVYFLEIVNDKHEKQGFKVFKN